jgi:hypothetical protein
MWRTSNDFWDRWVDLKKSVQALRSVECVCGPNHWPDGDTLPLGHIGIRAERGDPRMSLLTHDEQLTLMTLWSIARSPLMFGGHLPENDDFTLSLLTNDEVLAVNQNAQIGRQLWAFSIPAMPPSRKFTSIGAELGLPAKCVVRDLWSKSKQDVGTVENGGISY